MQHKLYQNHDLISRINGFILPKFTHQIKLSIAINIQTKTLLNFLCMEVCCVCVLHLENNETKSFVLLKWRIAFEKNELRSDQRQPDASGIFFFYAWLPILVTHIPRRSYNTDTLSKWISNFFFVIFTLLPLPIWRTVLFISPCSIFFPYPTRIPFFSCLEIVCKCKILETFWDDIHNSQYSNAAFRKVTCSISK